MILAWNRFKNPIKLKPGYKMAILEKSSDPENK